MINLEQLRNKAIQDDMCFSETTLKREYRMKLNPDAVPVKFYKSQYGGQFAVYRITDCTPMPEKRPRTQKQVEAGEKLADLARRNSKTGRAAQQAETWLAVDPLFIDTETTGIDDNDQVIEIAVVDKSGTVLLETRLRPSVEIQPGAQALHGISAENLVDAPTWTETAPHLRRLFEGRTVIAFNHHFDSRLLQQTAQAHGDNCLSWDWQYIELCAMDLAAKAYGATNRHGSISLAAAVSAAGIDWQGEAHSAAGDALTTVALVKAIAALLPS